MLLLRFLWSLGSVERTGLCPAFYTSGIQSSSKDVVTYTREVFHTTAANEHDGVLLQVVALARDVRVDLLGVGKTYTCNLTHC